MRVWRFLQRCDRRVRRRTGFTLIELTTVTAIMTGLAANSNNFAACKDKARQTVCRENLRQIYQGLQMFIMDEGSYPHAWFYPPDNHPRREQYNIARLLHSYTGAPQLFICPSAAPAIQQRKIAYLWNDALNSKPDGSISNPTATWVMEDINAVTTKVPPSHDTGYNVLCADGHVRFVTTPPQLRPTR